jgi:hypothetical protein
LAERLDERECHVMRARDACRAGDDARRNLVRARLDARAIDAGELRQSHDERDVERIEGAARDVGLNAVHEAKIYRLEPETKRYGWKPRPEPKRLPS